MCGECVYLLKFSLDGVKRKRRYVALGGRKGKEEVRNKGGGRKERKEKRNSLISNK